VASAQSITVTNSWASVLGELERQIEAGEAIGAAVDLTLPKLTLTSTDGNKSFSIDAVGADPDDRFTALGTNPLTLAASGIKQVSELSLAPGVSVASGDVYTLVLTDNSGVVHRYPVASDYRANTPVTQPTSTNTQQASSSLEQIDEFSLGGAADAGATYKIFLTTASVDVSANSFTVTEFDYTTVAASAEAAAVLTSLANQINGETNRFVNATVAGMGTGAKLVLTSVAKGTEFVSSGRAYPGSTSGEGTASLALTFDNIALSTGQVINLVLGWTASGTKTSNTASYTVGATTTWAAVLDGIKAALPSGLTSTNDSAARMMTISGSGVSALELRSGPWSFGAYTLSPEVRR
jgi:hypothetical protein